MTENRQVIIASLPQESLGVSDFEVRSVPLAQPGEGELLCETVALTVGAGQRAGLQGSASYAGAPRTGIVMGGTGVARVKESRAPGFSAGDLVVGPTGWQEYPCGPAKGWQIVDDELDPAHHLGVLGTNGLTAYFGLLEIGKPAAGETVVVSAGAGSVGHLVGQIARIRGSRVVGVTGSSAKCDLLVDELGFDAAVNYKESNFRDLFKSATPDRIDVYFDNTGGDILGSALFRMNAHGRIVCCGAVSQYDTKNPGAGPRGVPGLLVNNRVRMEGFLIFDYASRFDVGRRQLRDWLKTGELVEKRTEFSGLGHAPEAFVALLSGRTTGTTIVRVSE